MRAPHCELEAKDGKHEALTMKRLSERSILRKPSLTTIWQVKMRFYRHWVMVALQACPVAPGYGLPPLYLH